MTADPNQHDIFVLRQKIKLAINHYEFFLADADGTPGEPIAFVEQKRFKFKEDIRFYTDASKTQELLRIKARQRFDPRATYDITDEAGTKIGEISKVFGASLLRSTFRVNDAAGQELRRRSRARSCRSTWRASSPAACRAARRRPRPRPVAVPSAQTRIVTFSSA